jgi:lipocalin
MKPLGWRGESYRHYLAQKGVKTKIDLKKYQGTWYQASINRVPWYEKGLTNVKAKYKLLPNGQVQVINSGVDENGKLQESRGIARSVSEDNRHLKVSFFPPFEGDYNIKEIDPKYTRVKVEGGGTKWVLTRAKPRYLKRKQSKVVGERDRRPWQQTTYAKKKRYSRKREIEKGTKVEKEHTKTIMRIEVERPKPAVAAKWVAIDHVNEFPGVSYYDALDVMEEQLKRRKV